MRASRPTPPPVVRTSGPSSLWIGLCAVALTVSCSVCDTPRVGIEREVLKRPYTLHVPTGYDASQPTPLVVLLPGYGATAQEQDMVYELDDKVDTLGFFYVMLEGTLDQDGQQFWNATDGCCNYFGSTVDDVGYIDTVLDDVAANYNVDPKRIYVTGHSNGGYMAHRYACERSERVAAILALAGHNWKDPSRCTPTTPVSVLQVHGTADSYTPYNGGTEDSPLGATTPPKPAPSAHESVQIWSDANGCQPNPEADPTPVDLVSNTLPESMGGSDGAETRIERWTGCPPGGAVELWTMNGVEHIMFFNDTWADTIMAWFLAHPKP